jgi:DNA-binding NtrC family response regulator
MTDPDVVLLTFVDFYTDPFGRDAEKDAGLEGLEPGPLLKIFDALKPDSVYIFYHPGWREIGENIAKCQEEIKKRDEDVTVEVMAINTGDPSDHLGLLKDIKAKFGRILKQHPNASFSVNVTSGTTAMCSSMLLIAASGEIPGASVFQSKRRRDTKPNEKPVVEIDFSNRDFPDIKPFKYIGASQDDLSEADGVAQELGIIGNDPTLKLLLNKASKVAETETAVLILGESGTGKDLVAQYIHRLSYRSGKLFRRVNAGGMNEELADSTLFGHKRGAFTGATSDNDGEIEAANGGTLFIDEIGDMPVKVQLKLLTLLENKTYRRLGDTTDRKADVRIVGATNVDIKKGLKDGTFRQDFYQRFGIKIDLPALRERSNDIPMLADFFLSKWNDENNPPEKHKRLTNDTRAKLSKYSWPNNVRQLKDVVETAALFAESNLIKPDDIEFDFNLGDGNEFGGLPIPNEDFDLNEWLSDAKLKLMQKAVDMCNGKKADAAKLLGCTPQNLTKLGKTK